MPDFKLKITKLNLAVIALLFSMSLNAQRGLKVGYVDMEYVLDNVPEYRQASQMLDQKIQDWKSQIALQQTKIDNLKEQLENERPLLTPELIEEKEEEINYLQEQLFNFQDEKFGASGEFIVQKRQLIQPIEDQVFNAVQEISKVRDYDFIFERSAEALLLFAAKRHDISDRVLQLINRSSSQSSGDEDKKDEPKQSRKEKEEEKNVLQEIAEEPYKSVKDAKEDEEKQKAREEEIAARERERDSIRESRERIRDSIREARQQAFEERRKEAQRKRDSIKKARENNN